jgi:shikimate dehydrogenase
MERALSEASLDTRFLTLEVSAEDIGPAVHGMRAMGMRGAMLFAPHRRSVMPHLDSLTDRASYVEEVNLLMREGKQLVGDHIVGMAVHHSLGNDIDVTKLNVLILGAGAAARSVAFEFASHGARNIFVVNRTAEPGERLVATLGQRFDANIQFQQWVSDIRPGDEPGVIVLAASMDVESGQGRVPIELAQVAPGSYLVDMRPCVSRTKLLDDATAQGLNVVTGLDVQISEAMIAFQRWTGVRPDPTLMRDALEEFLLI